MLIGSLQPEELRILTAALDELCAVSANDRHRERVRELLLICARDGVTNVTDLVDRTRELLEDDAPAHAWRSAS